MSYTHLTLTDRVCIYHQHMCNFNFAEIGRRLHRHRATIRRELKRYRRHPSYPYNRQYCPEGGQWLAVTNRNGPRGFRWTRDRSLLAYVLKGLRKDWSPEQISGRLKQENANASLNEKKKVSHQSIYRYIKADKKAGGTLWKRLRQSHKKRRKSYGSAPRVSRIPDRVGIEDRPASVEDRKQSGHWEADTMMASGGRLGTVVERKSRYVIIALLPNGKACEFNTAAFRHLRKIPASQRKTLTMDNGSEFVSHKELSARLGFKTFFARPYASWERGTNENTNGLIRQYVPKKSDLSKMSPQRIAKIEKKLNNRPRKCLGYKTPAEVIEPLLRL